MVREELLRPDIVQGAYRIQHFKATKIAGVFKPDLS